MLDEVVRAEGKGVGESAAARLNESLEKRIDKRFQTAKSAEKTQLIVILVCTIYFVANYLKIY